MPIYCCYHWWPDHFMAVISHILFEVIARKQIMMHAKSGGRIQQDKIVCLRQKNINLRC